MSNLAVKYKKQPSGIEATQNASTSVQSAKVTVIEKVLYTAFVAFLLYVAIIFIGNKAALYEVNTEVSQLQKQIDKQLQTNSDLKAEVELLSRYERIAEVAGRLGMTIDANNVKGIGQ
ncbi:cell division protein FtsL [Ectobacillus sp. JY-23]|uniref:cell division protein FtsL n=1 Tax=Ectobacillus sp. JY-23 TaxID=2933872 RepID=UPI001FF3EDE5|nr:cell division protein FtsL [Ectobacillus sp. JY-23]UOY93737.1 cell division protein FtsL [Ectobacillus sp. JY-23]